eukprot:6181681-Pleurochrysis_carterae.AAC.1
MGPFLTAKQWLFQCGDNPEANVVSREVPRFTAKAWPQKCGNNPEADEVKEVRRNVSVLCAWMKTDPDPARGRRVRPTGEASRSELRTRASQPRWFRAHVGGSCPRLSALCCVQ